MFCKRVKASLRKWPLSWDLKVKEKPLCDLSCRAFQAERSAKALRRSEPQNGEAGVTGIGQWWGWQHMRSDRSQGQVQCSAPIVLLFSLLQGYLPSTNPFPLVSPWSFSSYSSTSKKLLGPPWIGYSSVRINFFLLDSPTKLSCPFYT